MRIVSLNCSNTEIVCALGLGADLVGVDDDSDYPTDIVAPLPRVGRDLDVDVERVRALEPDLVIASLTVPGHEKVLERLEAAGLPYVAPEPVCLADIYRDIEDIAERLGVPERAAAVIDDMRAAMPPRDVLPDAPTILVEWWPKPVIAPGRLSWVTDLIALAGGRNPLGDDEVKSRPLEDETVADIAPDVIVLSWCGVSVDKYRPDVVYRNEAFADVPAVRDARVVPITEAWLGRPSPRVVDGYRALREIVETFERR